MPEKALETVSVIIPTYNRRQFLQEALGSVWEQNHPPLEVIVVDDGSSDGTWEYLQGIKNSKLKTLQTPRKGPAVARNRGAALARGFYLAFLDSDDLWLKEKLAHQVEFLQRHPEYRFCQTEEIWLRNGVRVNPRKRHGKPSGWVFADCLELCKISPSAVLLERQFFESLGGFDENFMVCEDFELWLRASLRSPFATLKATAVVKRGGHADQLSQKYPAMDRFRVKALTKVLGDPCLSSEQRDITLAELKKKLKILALGHTKRFPEQPNPYQEKLAEVEALPLWIPA